MRLKFLKFFSLRSLRFKFTLTSTAIFLVIFSTASSYLINQVSSFEKQSLVSRAQIFTTLATKPLGDAYSLYFDSGNLKFREVFSSTLKLSDTVIRTEIISVSGEILFDSANIDETTPKGEDKALQKISGDKVLQAIGSDQTTKLLNSRGDIAEIIVPYSDDFGIRAFSLRYFISYDSIYASINQAILTTLILVLILFLVSIFTVTFLVDRSIISPLDKIVEAAGAIQNGNLQKRIELKTRDELADLANSLNQMTETLRRNIEGLKQVDKLKDEFIFIASHNLRTPLTIIKDYLPSLANEKLDKNGQEAIGAITESAAKLSTITESLLNLVSLEREETALKKTPEDLVDIIREVTNDLRQAADSKQLKITLDVPPQPVHCQLDKLRIKQAFANIFDNAVKFNKPGGSITAKIEVKDNQALVSVSDTGIGISPSEIEKMFQKFHRGTDVLTYNYEGIGLGLYLTKIIVESHGGKVSVSSKLGEGTIVNLTLPLDQH